MLEPRWRLFDTGTERYVRYPNGNIRTTNSFSDATAVAAMEYPYRVILVTQDTTLENAMTRQQAMDRVDAINAQLESLIKEAEKLALEHKFDFAINVPGSNWWFDGAGQYGEEPTGWSHSQC